jgi:hypothetical protein
MDSGADFWQRPACCAVDWSVCEERSRRDDTGRRMRCAAVVLLLLGLSGQRAEERKISRDQIQSVLINAKKERILNPRDIWKPHSHGFGPLLLRLAIARPGTAAPPPPHLHRHALTYCAGWLSLNPRGTATVTAVGNSPNSQASSGARHGQKP